MKKFPCDCICHTDRMDVKHIMPCRPHTGKKYIFEDGTIDMKRFGELEKVRWEGMKEEQNKERNSVKN